ncbi:hypothetical protein BH24ACT15_BH24ACT15_33330 [soil metagenome]
MHVDEVQYPLKIELVPTDHGWKQFPTSATPTELRYDGLPTYTDLMVPTSDAFAAMKLAAWADRRTHRDLADLYALSMVGAITTSAVNLARFRGFPAVRGHWSARHPTGLSDEDWEAALTNQLAEVPPAVVAWRVTRAAIATTLSWEDAQRWEAEAADAVADVEVRMDTSIDLSGPTEEWPQSRRGTPYCGAATVLGIPCTNPATPGGSACTLHFR